MRLNPISETIAMENPKLKATLSMLPREFVLGKRATINIYPGKNNNKGNPKIIRKTLEEEKAITMMSSIAGAITSRGLF